MRRRFFQPGEAEEPPSESDDSVGEPEALAPAEEMAESVAVEGAVEDSNSAEAAGDGTAEEVASEQAGQDEPEERS